MQKSATTTVISTITFTHSGIEYKIVYNGPISAANVIVSQLYPGASDRKGDTTVSQNDLTRGDFKFIEIATDRVVCSNGYNAPHINDAPDFAGFM